MGFTEPDRSPDPLVSFYLTVSPLPRPGRNSTQDAAVFFLWHCPCSNRNSKERWGLPTIAPWVGRSPDFPPKASADFLELGASLNSENLDAPAVILHAAIPAFILRSVIRDVYLYFCFSAKLRRIPVILDHFVAGDQEKSKNLP